VKKLFCLTVLLPLALMAFKCDADKAKDEYCRLRPTDPICAASPSPSSPGQSDTPTAPPSVTPSPSSSPGPSPSGSPSASPTALPQPSASPSVPSSPAPCATVEVIDFTNPPGCRACSEWKRLNTDPPPDWVVRIVDTPAGRKKFFIVERNRDEFGNLHGHEKWYDENCDEWEVGGARKIGRLEGACDVRVQTTCPQPSPSTSPTPAPTASPTPGPSPTPTPGGSCTGGADCDVARFITLNYGGCKQKGRPFKLNIEACRKDGLWVTYTPKRAAVDANGKAIDAKCHGRQLRRWIIGPDGVRHELTEGGDDHCVDCGPIRFCGSDEGGEGLFNAKLWGNYPGRCKLSASLECGGQTFWSDVVNDLVAE
jgi:hypothetical protein